jgi:alanine-glyoxylate transaminase / serine-glyoxylate transaminase / serine-pyruvate transaminase
MSQVEPFDPPLRVLLGPGPSTVPPSVLRAMAAPTIGHLDPRFLQITDQVCELLRQVFETENKLTLPISGTGSAGMEAVLVNLIEPADRALIGVSGVFGARMAEVARRAGAEVVEVTGEWGRAIAPEAFRQAARGKRYKLLCAVHAETSTGVLQPLEPLREIADELGALLVVDAVTSLGGLSVATDERRLDAVYSGTQKCLSCPPGLSPLTFSEAAESALKARKRPVQSWYLDLTLVTRYFGSERVYHHTAPINMIYALHEALRLVTEETLPARWSRHRLHAAALWAGLEALGLELVVPPSERLPTLTTVRIPTGIDDAAVRRSLLEDFNVEIGGGLGPFKGNTWRIGLMGASSTRQNVNLCLSSLRAAMAAQGFRAEDPIAAADAVYRQGPIGEA